MIRICFLMSCCAALMGCVSEAPQPTAEQTAALAEAIAAECALYAGLEITPDGC
jgi:hypothetical protein